MINFKRAENLQRADNQPSAVQVRRRLPPFTRPRPTRTPIPPTPTPAPTDTPDPAAEESDDPTPTPEPTDPPAPVLDVEMVLIPAGEFTMGVDGGDTTDGPAHVVNLPDYEIDKFEVTNDDFSLFVELTGYATDAEQSPVGSQ